MITGSLSGSALVTVGGSTFGGSLRIAADFFADVFRRFADIALQNKGDNDVRVPSVTIERISSMPLTAAIDSSSGRTTCEVTSSGLAPGR